MATFDGNSEWTSYHRGTSGADTFVFKEGHGDDKIYDFGNGDVIDLSGFNASITWQELRDCMSVQEVFIYGPRVIIDLTKWGGGRIEFADIASIDHFNEDMFKLPTAIVGGEDRDHLYGDAADNEMLGRGGDDVIVGGKGDDTIVGGRGDDFLYGDGPRDSGGRDTFVYAPGDGNDTIQEFGNGDDRIDLSAFSGIKSFSDISARQVGGQVVIDFSGQGGGSITLKNFHLSDLDAEDFIFHGDADAYDG